MADAAGDRGLMAGGADMGGNRLAPVEAPARAEIENAVFGPGGTDIFGGAGVGAGRMSGNEIEDLEPIFDIAEAVFQAACGHGSGPLAVRAGARGVGLSIGAGGALGKRLPGTGSPCYSESVRMYLTNAGVRSCVLRLLASLALRMRSIFLMPSVYPHPERSAEGAQSNGRTMAMQSFILRP